MKIVKILVILILAGCSSCKKEPKVKVDRVSSTNHKLWESKAYTDVVDEGLFKILIRLDIDKTQQTMDNFSGCFNELGWEALGTVKPEEKQQVLNDLFSTKNGCKFNIL